MPSARNGLARCRPLSMKKHPIRLPMKFTVSLAYTTPLPSWSAPNAANASITSSLVCSPGTSSNNFITLTGLKKCGDRDIVTEAFGHARGDVPQRDARSVRADHRTVTTQRFDVERTATLRVEVFDDGLADPVVVGDSCRPSSKVPVLDEMSIVFVDDLQAPFDRLRRDVEHQHPAACRGARRSDACSHRAATQHRHRFDPASSCHLPCRPDQHIPPPSREVAPRAQQPHEIDVSSAGSSR